MSKETIGSWGDKKNQLKPLGLTIDSAAQFCNKMDTTGGWRLRADLASAIENARMSFSAAQSHYDDKNWKMVLLELSDGLFAVEEVKMVLGGKKIERMSELL